MPETVRKGTMGNTSIWVKSHGNTRIWANLFKTLLCGQSTIVEYDSRVALTKELGFSMSVEL